MEFVLVGFKRYPFWLSYIIISDPSSNAWIHCKTVVSFSHHRANQL